MIIQYPLVGSRTSRCVKQRLTLRSFMMLSPQATSAVMYLGFPVFTIAVGLILAQVTIAVGLVGSQLAPPAITGMTHQLFGISFAVKKFLAVPRTVSTCPLFWQIGVPMPIVPSILPPEHVLEVCKPAFMSGAPEEQSKKVVQHEF